MSQVTALTSESTTTTLATLNALETRVRRLEFLLTGQSDVDGIPVPPVRVARHSETISARLEQLQTDLSNLKDSRGVGGSLVRDVDSLYSRYPELFKTPALPSSSSQLEVGTKASIVLSHASLYPETASRLSSLQTLQMPTADQSARLVELAPRIEKASKAQRALDERARELRERSARLLQWWVEVGCAGMGGLWEDWMGRVGKVERKVHTLEKKTREEEGYL